MSVEKGILEEEILSTAANDDGVLCDEGEHPLLDFNQECASDGQTQDQMPLGVEQRRLISLALYRSFHVLNYVDLNERSYVNLWSKDYVRVIMAGATTAEEGFDRFVENFVRPEFAQEVHAFCNMDTLAQRLEGKTQIECEYLSKIAKVWCRVSFCPAQWDEAGKVTHVLFAVKPVDEHQARVIERGISSQKYLKSIFDEVPCGIVLYRWDGEKLVVLRMSSHYQRLYGYSMQNDTNTPDFQRIHPDDIDDYQRAIHHALTETHSLEYVFRAWNRQTGRYGWTKICAIAKPQPDGTSYVYAVYTDITDQKIAELRLAKSNASIVAALGASEQFSYEYDPVLHTSTNFVDAANQYALDTVIRNYPECFRENDFMHPDDVEPFIATARQIDEGADSAQCIIRANAQGTYHWHSCSFEAFYDSEKGYRVALLTVVDITSRVTARQTYENRISSLLSAQDGILTMCSFDLATDTFELFHIEDEVSRYAACSASFEETILGVAADIVDTASREAYVQKFNRQNMLEQARLGNTHLEQEYLLKMSADHYEWVTAVVDLVENPLTGEMGGVAYSVSSQKTHMGQELLSRALKDDYVFAAIAIKDTDEYYIYSAELDGFSERKEHFWDMSISEQDPRCSEEVSAYMRSYYRKDWMCAYLDEHQEFTYAFDCMHFGDRRRLEVRFRYLDDTRNALLVVLRDITDRSLQEKWRYDSQHDALTGLLNRKTVFEESRKLLDAHPDTQFIMVHCDVRHFHLYNTFFGEEAGDELLCRIAEALQGMEKDYNCFTCARIESDVFCAFFPEQPELFERHTRESFNELDVFSPDFPLELNVGAYWVEDASMPIEAMFTRATIAANSSKKNLFGLVSRYDDDMERELKNTQQIVGEMHNAIEEEQFEVYLQPKYSLRSGKVTGAEALVRWNHPQRGMVSPAAFIPVFESNGFIVDLDHYMWEHVCMILSRWQEEQRPLYPISVNISRVSMYSHATAPFLKSLVEKYNIDPGYMELELTETAYIDDPEDLTRILKELQDYGFKVLMDDFGSGYSSLNALRDLPVDVLKLDMRFLSDTQDDARGNAVLSSVVRMSKLLQLPIVAEGVERRDQADYLRNIGCEYAQGYLFARPMAVSDYEYLLASEDQQQDQVRVEQEAEDLANAAPLPIFRSTNSPVALSPAAGVVEYANERFAFVYANERFQSDFCLVEQSGPASEIFRAHISHKDNEVFLQALAYCAQSKTEALAFITWNGDDGSTRRYEAHIAYVEQAGAYASLFVAFLEVTYLQSFGMPFDASSRLSWKDDFARMIHDAVHVFERVFIVDLERNAYSLVEADGGGSNDIVVSTSFEEFFERAKQRFSNPFDSMIVDGCFDQEGLKQILKEEDRFYIECGDKQQRGRVFGVTIDCLERKNGVPVRAMYAIRDITDARLMESEGRLKLEKDNEKLRYMANRDGLTGLYNRFGLRSVVESRLSKDDRVALLLIDVDTFKTTNDTHGHVAGDKLLQRVASLLSSSFRSHDIVARLGGDEFLAILLDCDYKKGAFVAEHIKAINEKLAQPEQDIPPASVSVGVAFSRAGETHELYARADKALYWTKEHGRCGCCLYEDVFDE